MVMNDKENGPTAKLRRLKIDETIIWPLSSRRSVHVLANRLGMAVQVRVKDGLAYVTRISLLDKSHICECAACGHRHKVRQTQATLDDI